MLLSNPTAKLISFDIFSNQYTPAAVQSVHSMFPNREIIVIAGDSASSIPQAKMLFKQQKCNIMFVDGDHQVQSMLNDMYNIAHIVNETYNRIIVDDLDFPALEVLWDEMPEMTIFSQNQQFHDLPRFKKIKKIHSHAFDSVTPIYNDTTYHYNFVQERFVLSGDMGIGEFVF